MSRAIRILVLEDDTDMRDLLQEVLAERGFEVVAAGGGEEALRRARTESFDLIIADIRMEGITGLDAIEQAKEHQPDLGSIVISGYASEEETLRAVRLNVGGYLKKPFKMQQLLAQINEFVSQKTAERRRFEEHKTLREALLWSLESVGTLGEQLYRGKVRRSADLASGLANRLSQSGEASGQIRAAAILAQLEHLAGLKMPLEIVDQLLPLPVLRQQLMSSGTEEISGFAANLLREVGADDPMPAVEALPQETDARLRDAYREWLQHGVGEIAPEAEEGAGLGLLGLARAFEQARNFEEARRAYREVLEGTRAGGDAVSAWLGLARVGLAQRDRATLQDAITQALAVAEGLGPVALALAQLQGAELLDRGNHPATEKLLLRAAASLRAVHQEVLYARVVLKLARRGKAPETSLEEALGILGDPLHLPDVFESLAQVLPDLLELAAEGVGEKAERLGARLVRDYPHDVAQLLRQQKLQSAAKAFTLSVLEGDDAVPADLVQLLSADDDPDIKARAMRLGSGEAARPVLRVYSLGSQEVHVGDQQIEESDWKSLKVKNLFFHLASQRGKPAHVDSLMEEFWPGPLENARKNLNSAVSSIRKSLRGTDSDESWDPVPRHKDSLTLDSRLVLWHDYEELQKAYEAGRAALKSGQLEQGIAHYRRVARLYRGPYLEGCYMEWALTIRSATERLAGEALEQLVEHCLPTGSHKEALEYSIRLIEMYPDKQEAHHAKMRAHVGLGQPELAMKQYEACARMLATEYGVEPNTDLLRTYHQARYGLGDAGSQLIG